MNKYCIVFPFSDIKYLVISEISLDNVCNMFYFDDKNSYSNFKANYIIVYCKKTIKIINLSNGEIRSTTCNANKFEIAVKIAGAVKSTVKCKENWMCFHGAMFIINNKAYALLGKSFEGKSTLSAFLSKKNIDVVNDDFFAVHIPDCRAVSYYRPFMLRENTLNLLDTKYNLKIFNDCKLVYFDDYKRYLLENEYTCRDISDRATCILEKIYILNRTKDDNIIVTSYVEDKILELIQNSYISENIKQIIILAAKISKKIPIIKLHYQNLDQLYHFLIENHNANC